MPQGNYNSAFTVAGGPHGFDVRTNGYGWTSEANTTIRLIPWATSRSIVVQSAGQLPWERRYRAIFYTENDFNFFMTAVSATGTLITPREPSILVQLAKCERDDMQAPMTQTSPGVYNRDTGELTALLTFKVIA